MSENIVWRSLADQDWLEPVAERGAELVKESYAAAGPAGQAAKNALHGVWLGHPLHPAITDVPVGSWTVAACLDALELGGATKYQAGADAAVMIGLVGSLPAALSGLTDWADTHGKPQRVGVVHGLLNLAAVALYASSYAARKSRNRGLGKVLGFAAFGLVAGSAYLGGELSYSKKIGVNHAPDPEGELPTEYTAALKEQDLAEGKPATATVDGTEILLLKKEGHIYAMAAKCSHMGGPLAEGTIEGDTIVCPWHGSRFCLRDGNVIDGPATSPQPVLDVKIIDGTVLVKTPAGASS